MAYIKGLLVLLFYEKEYHRNISDMSAPMLIIEKMGFLNIEKFDTGYFRCKIGLNYYL